MKHILNLFFCLFVTLLLFSCKTEDEWKKESFKTEDGWGYIITRSGKIYIKQSVIPVISQNKSFSTEEDALNTAALVIKRIRSKNLPTVTKKDLQQLNIIDK